MIDKNSEWYLRNVLLLAAHKAFSENKELPITRTWADMIQDYDKFVTTHKL